jgi:uncharacterized LabA/DUF88 family protein
MQMKGEMQLRSDRLAVLIDADNVNSNWINPILDEMARFGVAHTKRIYGDWTTPQLSPWKEVLHEFAILPIQQFSYTKGKNSTDGALIIDAMDLLYTKNFDGFCLVSSDSDFTRLANRIREAGISVYGFGERKTPKAFVNACDRFIYIENIVPESQAKISDKQSAAKSKSASDKQSSVKSQPSAKDIEPESTTKSSPKSTQSTVSSKDLKDLLEKADNLIPGEEEWVELGTFGSYLTKIAPDFDSRNYGCKKLSDLVRATPFLEIQEVPQPKNPNLKLIQVRLKPS